jgi:hypothetical protein
MSDQHPNGDDIARMLREQGRVQAPPDLADEVMRQVRAEPREQPKPERRRFRLPSMGSVLVPALGIALVAALIVGIAHAPHGSSSSAGGGSSAALEQHSAAAGPSSGGGAGGSTRAAAPKAADARSAFVISSDAARKLTVFGPLAPTAKGSATPSDLVPNAYDSQAIANLPSYRLLVPASRYSAAAARLQLLARAYARQHSGRPAAVVILQRKP